MKTESVVGAGWALRRSRALLQCLALVLPSVSSVALAQPECPRPSRVPPYIKADPNPVVLPLVAASGKTTITWDAGETHPLAHVCVEGAGTSAGSQGSCLPGEVEFSPDHQGTKSWSIGAGQTHVFRVYRSDNENCWASVTLTSEGGGADVGGPTTADFPLIFELCQTVGCPPPGVWTPPAITGVFPLVPGSMAFMIGHHFGSLPGKVFVRGRFGPGFSSKVLELPVLEWGPEGKWVSAVTDQVPYAPEHQVTWWVETKYGEKSNEYSGPYEPILDYRRLLSQDVEVLYCGDGASWDECNGWSDPEDAAPFLGSCPDEVSAYGNHLKGWWSFGTYVDDDRFEVAKLKNGWKLEDMEFSVYSSDEGEAWATAPQGFWKGADSWKPTVHFSVNASDEVLYCLYIDIVGPEGTSHK